MDANKRKRIMTRCFVVAAPKLRGFGMRITGIFPNAGDNETRAVKWQECCKGSILVRVRSAKAEKLLTLGSDLPRCYYAYK